MATYESPGWSAFLSPLRLILLAVNGICLGACLVLLVIGLGSVLLTIGVGLSFGAGAVGAYKAVQQRKSEEQPRPTEDQLI